MLPVYGSNWPLGVQKSFKHLVSPKRPRLVQRHDSTSTWNFLQAHGGTSRAQRSLADSLCRLRLRIGGWLVRMDCSGCRRVISLCTKVVLLLVLLVSFLDLPKIEEEYQVLEYFAGVGRVAALAKFCHYRSAALDIKYGEEGFLRAKKRSPMDINSDAGLVQLVSKYEHFLNLFTASSDYVISISYTPAIFVSSPSLSLS